MFTCKLFPGRSFKKIKDLEAAEEERKIAIDLLNSLKKKINSSKIIRIEKVPNEQKNQET
jgi:hypothetical protein